MSPEISDLLATTLGASDGNAGRNGIFSLTLATVKNIKDKKNLNRVRCLPIGAKDDEMTDWCYVMTPMGGKESGLFLFPQVGDLVVLGYLGNNVHRPIVLGSFWSTASAPPLKVKDGKIQDYCFKTPTKMEVTVHDENKKQKIYVKTPTESQVIVDEEKQTILTRNKGNDTALIMKMKDGEVELKAKSKLTIKVGKGSITLDTNGDITLKTSGKIVLDGKSVEGKAKGKLAMQGMDVAVQANKNLDMKAAAQASVKGAILKLN